MCRIRCFYECSDGTMGWAEMVLPYEEDIAGFVKFWGTGGKITKLPDGPDYHFQPYGVRVTPGDPKMDLTVSDTPTTKQQISYVEKNSL